MKINISTEMARKSGMIFVFCQLLLFDTTKSRVEADNARPVDLGNFVFLYDTVMAAANKQVCNVAAIKLVDELRQTDAIIHNYTVIPVSNKDPPFPELTTTDVESFKNTMGQGLQQSDSDQAQILKAIDQILFDHPPNPFIVVCTDSYPSTDRIILRNVLAPRSSETRVIFLLSANAKKERTTNVPNYDQISISSKGQIFSFETSENDIPKVVQFMYETMKPQNGSWSEWSKWRQCGQLNSSNGIDPCLCSTRQCNNPVPKHGGDFCRGEDIQVTNCTIQGGWSEWSEWRQCDRVNASNGTNPCLCSTRQCNNPVPKYGGAFCRGEDIQIINCTINGGWSEWSSWSQCEVDSSNETNPCFCMARQCNNPVPKHGGAFCKGIAIQINNCTIHGGWSEWSEWSACNSTYGSNAVKKRTRECTNPAPAFGGRICVGHESEQNFCTDNLPGTTTIPERSRTSLTTTTTTTISKPDRNNHSREYVPLKWVKRSLGEVAENALLGGMGVNSGEVSYIARVLAPDADNHLIPAKLICSQKKAYYSKDGLELSADHYEVLCGKLAKWVPSADWRGQPGAVPVDERPDRSKWYICRAHHLSTIVSGKVDVDGGDCYIPFNGRELKKETYDILFYEYQKASSSHRN